MFQSKNLTILPQKEYELLDSGEGEKLECFGAVVLSRPDPQALWPKSRLEEWKRASAEFRQNARGGAWVKRGELPNDWQIKLGGLDFKLKLSNFKHVGVFPEQIPQWEWIERSVKLKAKSENQEKVEKPKILNLFGYTGGATLATAKAGAEVCHVDGSKVALATARENAELSNLAGKPIRWILDDALDFVKRELKRGRRYDGIILDPPSYGHGPKGELWKLEKNLLPLLADCFAILSEGPCFFIINGYASGYSSAAYANNLVGLVGKYGGAVEHGEYLIKEANTDRYLPAGIYARWRAD